MNEETIIQPRPTNEGQATTKKETSAWKHVTLGGVSGILMGAGLLYAGQVVAANKADDGADENASDVTTVSFSSNTASWSPTGSAAR